MGGAASKDFLENNGPKAALARELDELGGYDRPALAKNESFTARLEWLGNQVGKASDQIEAALSKDESAGRRELEKEAKRRQLMALRRGQGDYRLDLQYADFYLKQKQFERAPGSGGSIIRPPSLGVQIELPPEEPTSPKTEAAKKSAERIATLTRVYSKGASGSFTNQGERPVNKDIGQKWRQTVAHAKKTAFLAIGGIMAINGKRNRGPARIDNFGMYAEQHLGDGMHKFAEETAKLATAREKLPAMKAELETLRSEMRQLAEEQALAELAGDEEEEEEEQPEPLAPVEENDGDTPEQAAATAASAARTGRISMNGASANGPKWHYAAKSDLFGPPPPISSFPKPKPLTPRGRDPTSSPHASGHLSLASGHLSLTPHSPGPVAPPSPSLLSQVPPSVFAHANAPSPTPGSAPSTGPGTAPVVAPQRRRVSTGSPQLLSHSVNGPLLPHAPPGVPPLGFANPAVNNVALVPHASLATSPAHGLSGNSLHNLGFLPSGGSAAAGGTPLGVAGPGLTPLSTLHSQTLGMIAPGALGPQAAPTGGLNVVGGPAGPSGRASAARSSWSGGTMAAAAATGSLHTWSTDFADAEALRASSASASGAALKPTKPALATSRLSTAPAGAPRSRSEPTTSATPAAAAALASSRPASGARGAVAPARPPSGNGTPPPPASARATTPVPRSNEDGLLSARTQNNGEYRPGTMAQRVASKAPVVQKKAPKSVLRALREAETQNILKQQQLLRDIEENMTLIQSAAGLLNMFCNRANGRWVEAQNWALPPVHEMALPQIKRQADRYKELVLRDLREGKLAVVIHVDDDNFNSARIGAVPMWSTDPWQLLSTTHPARVDAASHLVGLGMGVRQLLALATAVEGLVGTDALAKLPVVVACHEGQVDTVVRDLSSRRLCRFNPDNLIVTVVQRAPGHSYNPHTRSFVPAREAPLRPSGSGYAMLALGWVGDAFRLTGPELDERTMLDRSALDIFNDKGVEWLVSWRLRDMVHYSPETCLNVEQVAMLYALMDSMDANMAMQVELMEGLQGAQRSGSGIVLGLKERGAPPPPAGAVPTANVSILRGRLHDPSATSASGEAPGSSNTSIGGGVETSAHSASRVSPLARTPSSPHAGPRFQSPFRAPDSPHGPRPPGMPSPPSTSRPGSFSAPAGGYTGTGGRRLVTPARAGGIGGDGGPLPACDIKWTDVQTPALATGLQQLIDLATIQTGHTPRLAISIKRYVYHVPTLRGLLTGPSVFRPAISVDGGYLYVTFDASDLSALPGARCAAMSYTPRPTVPGILGSAHGTAASTAAANPSTSGGGAAAEETSATLLPPVRRDSGGSSGGGANKGPTITTTTSPGRHAPGRPRSNGSSLLRPTGQPQGPNSAFAGVVSVAAQAAAAAALALQRGRLLTNDSDLDTLLWVMQEQDSSPSFRAGVSATNTARSRATAHAGGVQAAAGALAAAVGRPVKPPPPQNVIVVAVADDAASPLAVRAAMGVLKPGADCMHVLCIAKDPSMMAMEAARNVAERFESMASATLGDVKSVVQVKRESIVEDIVAYVESVNAILLVCGSVNLAMPQGSSVVGSVALSVARECSRPVMVVKPISRLVETAFELGKKPCLRCMVPAEPSSRPLVRYVVSHVLDGKGRGDKLVLVRGKAFDRDMNELMSSRRILDHVADEAASNRRFDSSLIIRRMVPGSFDAEYGRVADVDQCHVVAVQVPEGRGPLPQNVINLLRTSRSAVLLYRTFSNKPPVTEAEKEAAAKAEQTGEAKDEAEDDDEDDEEGEEHGEGEAEGAADSGAAAPKPSTNAPPKKKSAPMKKGAGEKSVKKK